jgi:hypothetical protein
VKGHRTVPGNSIHSTATTHMIEMRDNVTVTFKMKPDVETTQRIENHLEHGDLVLKIILK